MSTGMSVSGVELRREYYRKWRAANRDKVKQYNDKYWTKLAETENCTQIINELSKEDR